ncbi:MAG: prepilin peptidase [Dehalococcoidales bacterium]|nr:prepilin peptidase [Dehalococcoidales bacterium]
MEIAIIILVGLLGAAIGSFLNVCIDRLPAEKSVISPPSSCDACHNRLTWLDLFPVFSYLFLRGRCRFCHAKIPQRIFWVELGTGILFAFLYWKYGFQPVLAINLFYGCILILLAVIDLEHGLILNKIVYPAAIVALILGSCLPEPSLKNFLGTIEGGAIGFAILFLPAVLSRGMGWGDVKMAGLIGLMTAFPQVFVSVLGGIILGGLIAVILILLKKKTRKDTIPFGPYLSIATMVTLIWGNPILTWYLHLFTINR